MRKIILAASGLALLASGSVFAADLHMGGQVPPVCEITGLTPSASFGSMTSGATVSSTITLTCNDADGADVTLRSAEGGMESDDDEDQTVEYTATLTIPGSSPVVLTTDPGPGTNDQSETEYVAGSPAFVSGLSGSLDVVLITSATYAGGYSDTLSVEITAL